MSFDEAGHQGHALAVDRMARRLGRNLARAARHGSDSVAFDQHFARVGVVALAIPDADVSEEVRRHRSSSRARTGMPGRREEIVDAGAGRGTGSSVRQSTI